MTIRTVLLLLLFAVPAYAEDEKKEDPPAESGNADPPPKKPPPRAERPLVTARGGVVPDAIPIDEEGTVPAPRTGPRQPAAPAGGDGTGAAGADGSGASGGAGTAGDAGAASASAGGDAPTDPAATARKSLWPPPKDALIQIDYDNVELKDIIKDFAEKTGRNFLIDPKVSGKVTIISPRPVSIDEAYVAFLAALDAAGYATVVEATYEEARPEYGIRKGDPMLTRILPAGEAKQEPLELFKGSYTPREPALVTRLIMLENVTADEISKVIQKMIGANGDLTVYAPSNMLILTDSGNNIRRLLELIKELDISAPKQKLEVVPVRYAEAARVVEIIREIYGDEAAGASGTTSPKSAAERRRASKAKAGEGAEAASAGATTIGSEASFIGKMIADDRTNSIIVLATEKSLGEIRDLIERIDYEVDPSAQSDIHVLYLSHAKAEELSATLNNLVQSSNNKAQQAQRGGAQASARGRANPAEANPPAQTSGQPGDAGGNFVGEVRVTHDVPTNSLVITASRDDMRRLRAVVEALDIPRKQVFVETVIMEVSDQLRNDTGVSWHGGKPGDATNPAAVNILGARGTESVNLASALLDGTLLGGIGLGIFGNSISIPLPGVDGGLEIPMFGIVLHALQADNATNVLSAPNLLTLDNEEASIEVGETVPFPSGGSLGSLASAAGAAGFSGFPSISFTREDVGIILKITPQVNEDDNVTLDVYQEISEVKEGTAGGNALTSGGPTTTKRSAETHVAVRSNQTVVIGGLMQEVETTAENKVPILGDIPLIGALFRNKVKTKRKTNLLIFLTPHVINGPEDLQEVYRIKMLQREQFMTRFYGKSPEEQRKELNGLIRYSMNLPDEPSVYRDKPPQPKERNLTAPVRGVEDAARDAGGGLLVTPQGTYAVEPQDEGAEAPPTDGGDTPPADAPPAAESAPAESGSSAPDGGAP